MHFSIPVISALMGALLFQLVASHSYMTTPQSISGGVCRLGGERKYGPYGTCAGPCDMRGINSGRVHFGSPDNPAATYYRGQKTRITYPRNNHRPGGFVRLTLVRPQDMMDKAAHERGAFWYGCWGAHVQVASKNQLGVDKFGFDMVGSDGQLHNLPISFYYNDVTIPEVVPDGNYILGWAWYGGMNGDGKMTKNEPMQPGEFGYFTEYWACAFVRIKGGAQLSARYSPRFVNELPQFSANGCKASVDALGVCTYEPCRSRGYFQVPKPFKGGKKPADLTPDTFGGGV